MGIHKIMADSYIACYRK